MDFFQLQWTFSCYSKVQPAYATRSYSVDIVSTHFTLSIVHVNPITAEVTIIGGICVEIDGYDFTDLSADDIVTAASAQGITTRNC